MARKSRASLADGLRALSAAAESSQGRVPQELVDEAHRVVRRADQRLRFSGEASVLALAGATGSGKSSLFNALAGEEISTPGIRRPTTSHATAVTWGDEPTEDLLDWIQVPRRHTLQLTSETQRLDGLVMLDLPDHDSIEMAHRMEVDRLVQLVDMLVWVVDPQKYADAALHDTYLVPLKEYAPVMMVVLNQVDRLSEQDRAHTMADLRALLDREGLDKVSIHAVSALTGEGIDELRQVFAQRAADKRVVADRMRVDVRSAATALAQASGSAPAPKVPQDSIAALDQACARAAGVPAVTSAVGASWRRRGRLATGWPLVSWVASLRPDPLRRLHLDTGPRKRRRREIEAGEDTSFSPTEVSTTSITSMRGVPASQVETAVRSLAEESSEGLSRGWADSVRVAARSRSADLPDELDRAVGTTNLHMQRNRRWWSVIRVLQWVLIAAVLAGVLWLAVDFALLYFQMPPLPEVTWNGFPVPTLLVVGGVVAGLLVGGLSRIGVEVGARRKVANARRALLGKINTVTRDLVVAPVNDELERYETTRENLRIAQS